MSEREEELKALRSDLETQHAGLVRRVSAITSDLRHEKGPPSSDWDDRAKERDNDEVLEALDDQGREDLQKIEVALRRFEAGVYGKCIDCDVEIPLPRLHAMPSALRCIECERARD